MAASLGVSNRNWMHDLGDYYDAEFVSRTHPNIMKWFLVGDFSKCLMIMFIYSMFVNYIGPAIMRNRKPFDLRWLMVPYNIILVVVNFYLFFQFVKSRWHGGMEVQCNAIAKSSLSQDPVTDPLKYKIAEMTWYFYMTKYVELLDTIFFVLRKRERQLSRLHIIHHTVVPCTVLLLLRSEPGGSNSFFPLANCFVHCIMYTYYAISAFGDDVTIHLKFKKYVTMTQMIQFILVIYYYFSRPFYGCKWQGLVAFSNLVIAGFFFVLFCNFYWNEYHKRKNEQELVDQNGYEKPKKVL